MARTGKDGRGKVRTGSVWQGKESRFGKAGTGIARTGQDGIGPDRKGLARIRFKDG